MLKILKNPIFSVSGLCFLLVGCGPVDDRVEITVQRKLPEGHQAPPLDKDFRERMLPMSKMQEQMTAPEIDGADEMNLADLFQSETPEGWREAPPTPMRLMNLRFGEGDVGECYLTILSGMGGGLAANAGRWYGQMGMEPPTAEELEALPRAPLLNRSAVVIDLEGSFTSMGSTAKPGYRMVGRILPPQQAGDTAFSMFLKMSGPTEVVAENLEKFEQFCQSLAPKTPASTE